VHALLSLQSPELVHEPQMALLPLIMHVVPVGQTDILFQYEQPYAFAVHACRVLPLHRWPLLHCSCGTACVVQVQSPPLQLMLGPHPCEFPHS
jgi:hypothetical protein